ncbi:agmatine deiminase family protein [Mycobacteroides abscessus]|uniref:Agmatine deiminase n=5 Tax=Mycobacteroides abscessus TaxID=36809 RepID=A0AB33ABC4_9MYCO|nr:agmatine deiminase family protein [Mycobacteroides abscessus]AGM29072.1 putative agmatine deiminase [Mycobacteroides abscessus subsp. bolletii 50594]AMU65985.1 agmatine deiminase [Mycobacteroides abscessus]ANO14572.1 agmatine deiminase [Mycobacteroides abscessus]ARQ64797.1 agmatine deiminase [Mycobacteroides abscessus subsp. massiliense]EHM17897.1 putative agmatine deiminase [Mycobacteroides abscessus subsp. massiliense CCUG 48898 = JCM 15300]
MNWLMPPETDAQERIWMAFPPQGASVFEDAESAHEARTAWAAVAHAIIDFEPVSMIVDPADRAVAPKYLSREIDVVEAPLDDAWMRDIGPTFVRGTDGRVAAVDWVFNGWGARDWARWDNDAHIGRFVGQLAGVEIVSSSLVNEGGGIQVDGEGTVLVTETVQLDPSRNPGLDKRAVEAELARTIGARHVIWLPRGLTRDAERFGTRGHVDILVAIPSPGRLLVHVQNDPAHPDHAITKEIVDLLAQSRDAKGKAWEITHIPAPAVLRDSESWVDYSYINHLVVNDGVIACRFDDSADDAATAILAEEYPGRRVVTVDAREIFARGGGIHCITQQQPAAS